MDSAVVLFALAAFCHFPLHHLEHFRVDDGFVVILDIVLRDFTLVDLGLLGQEIDGVAFLKERIALVLLIAEDTLDGGNAPFFLAAGCRNAVLGEGIGYAVVGHALQEQAVDALDDDCLLSVDHQIPVRASVVAKEALERNTDLSVCEAVAERLNRIYIKGDRKMVSVAIDGPAGAGKSTLARRLAAELGYIYVDTGAMYRAIGLYALRAGKDPKDNAAVDALLPQIELRLASIAGEQHIYLKDEDVSTAIRTEAAGMAASAVGANPAVRAFLLELQRSMAKKQDVLMDGRDIGTVVLPDATVKIFLTASPEARATRRWKEYQAKGIDTPYEEVLADVKQRDYQDTHRAAAPLKQAEDAVLLDTSALDFEQSLDAMKQIIAKKIGG